MACGWVVDRRCGRGWVVDNEVWEAVVEGRWEGGGMLL